jgi:hypothetical protein
MRTSFSLLTPAITALFILSPVSPTYLHADPFQFAVPYGVFVSTGLTESVPTTTLGGGGTQSLYANPSSAGPLPQAYYSAVAPVGVADSVTAFDPIANGLFDASSKSFLNDLSISNGEIHLWVTTSGATADSNVMNQVSGSAVANAEWFDTLTVSGPPAGTPVILEFTDEFDAVLQLSGNTANSSKLLQGVQLYELGVANNSCSSLSPADTVSFTSATIASTTTLDLCTYSGATIALSEYVETDLFGSGQWSASANASDTSAIYVKSLTPGAAVSSASGVSYVQDVAATPEPPTFVYLGTAALSLFPLLRRIARRQPRCIPTAI